MTSCVHKMCRHTYGQTNMKRAITLAKINHPWNRYNMHIPFHVCLTIRPSAHLLYATNHLSFVTFYSYLISWLAMIWACAYYTDFGQTNMKRPITLANINHPWNRYKMCMLKSWPTKILNMNKIDREKWLVAHTRCANGRMVKQTWKGL
jgi:hypothetical protein